MKAANLEKINDLYSRLIPCESHMVAFKVSLYLLTKDPTLKPDLHRAAFASSWLNAGYCEIKLPRRVLSSCLAISKSMPC
jgi:hypothetical protein